HSEALTEFAFRGKSFSRGETTLLDEEADLIRDQLGDPAHGDRAEHDVAAACIGGRFVGGLLIGHGDVPPRSRSGDRRSSRDRAFGLARRYQSSCLVGTTWDRGRPYDVAGARDVWLSRSIRADV